MKLSLKLDLLFIVALLTIMNIPFLAGIPRSHGIRLRVLTRSSPSPTARVYHDGQLPLWLPTLTMESRLFWLAALSAVNFLFIGIGKLFHIQNVLLLFGLPYSRNSWFLCSACTCWDTAFFRNG